MRALFSTGKGNQLSLLLPLGASKQRHRDANCYEEKELPGHKLESPQGDESLGRLPHRLPSVRVACDGATNGPRGRGPWARSDATGSRPRREERVSAAPSEPRSNTG